jgi:hypothetical protein
MDARSGHLRARTRAAGRPAAAVLALTALALLPPLASSTRLGGGRAPRGDSAALHQQGWHLYGHISGGGGGRDGATPASAAAPHTGRGGARRLLLGDAVQGCTQTFNSPPSLTSVTSAIGWELSRCGSWFGAADGQRYQSCYLSCASGTYADASTDFSNSSFWCARTEMDKAILCTEPSGGGA